MSHTPTQDHGVITKDPDILGGAPVFRGTRVPFQALLDYLEGGQTLDEFLEDFPTVGRETAVRALEHAKSLIVSQLPLRRLLEGKRKVPRLRSG
jgi:uncharacterized protein (DUF433 family)